MCDYSEAFEELMQFPLDAVPEAHASCFDVCVHGLEFSSFRSPCSRTLRSRTRPWSRPDRVVYV